MDLFIPKDGTAERRKLKKNLLKAAASKQKIEWLYINRICLAIVVL